MQYKLYKTILKRLLYCSFFENILYIYFHTVEILFSIVFPAGAELNKFILRWLVKCTSLVMHFLINHF